MHSSCVCPVVLRPLIELHRGIRQLPVSVALPARGVDESILLLLAEVVHSNQRESGYILVDWLRPAPLSGEKLRCVCEVGDASWLQHFLLQAWDIPTSITNLFFVFVFYIKGRMLLNASKRYQGALWIGIQMAFRIM